MRIKVGKNGPYVVEGVPLARWEIVTDEFGESVGYRELERFDVGERYMLCRCGRSKTKPFCDGAHLSGFDGTETARHGTYDERAEAFDGPGLRLTDVKPLCVDARFCAHGGGIWNLLADTDDPKTRAQVLESAQLCPSGRYVPVDAETGEALEPELEPLIVVLEDPHENCSGPLFVQGRVTIVDGDWVEYETRNRVTLCRCGQSETKPFCDGTHLRCGFKDESAPKSGD